MKYLVILTFAILTSSIQGQITGQWEHPNCGCLVDSDCVDQDPCTMDQLNQETCLCANIFIDNDSDGVCANDDPDDDNPCNPNNIPDTDGDGSCDQLDCYPNNPDLGAPGTLCDDYNLGTTNDVMNDECHCIGTPINDCEGNDQDGDGICDLEDPDLNDPCNGLKVRIIGDLELCLDQTTNILDIIIENGIEPYEVLWNTGETNKTINTNITLNTVYSVTITDALDCTSEATVSIDIVNDKFDVDIFPKFPGYCDESIGVVVTATNIVEGYTYEWTTPQGIIYDTEINATKSGNYMLKITNDEGCSAAHRFEVFDLKNGDLKDYFLNAGFYSLPVYLDEQLVSARSGNNDVNKSVSTCDDWSFSLYDDGNYFPYLSYSIDDYLENDNPIIETDDPLNPNYSTSYVVSSDNCICESMFLDIEEQQFYESQIGVWAHVHYDGNEEYTGNLFIKTQTVWDGDGPKGEHKEHLLNIHDEILENHEDSNQALAPIIKNNLFTHVPHGYNPDYDCSEFNLPGGSYLFTPTEEPVSVSGTIAYSKVDNDLGIEQGRLIAFKDDIDDTYLYSQRNFGSVGISNGYYNFIKGKWKLNFDQPTGQQQMSIFTFYEGQCYDNCTGDIDLYSVPQGFDFTGDGGVNQYPKSSFMVFDLLNDGKEERKTIIEIFNAYRKGGGFVVYPPIFNGKVITARDVYSQGIHYPLVVVNMPDQGSVLDIILNPIINTDTYPETDIEYGFQFTNDPSTKLAVYGWSNKAKKVKPIYEKTDWTNKVKKLECQGMICDVNLKYELEDVTFHQIISKKNLLLFVNGYRFKLSPDSDYPNSPGITLNDFDINTGSYWGEISEKFIKRINTKNVVYADGSYSILTSNHAMENIWNAGSISGAKIKFAQSAITSFCAKYGTVPFFIRQYLGPVSMLIGPCSSSCISNEECVELNDTKNEDGFMVRYDGGYLAGNILVQELNAEYGCIQLEPNEDGEPNYIDIVAHSMGYAHAHGMAQAIKDNLPDNVNLGNFYIIAPENACSAPSDVTLLGFDNVWQYGSRASGSDDERHKLYDQDGVAPQCAVTGLSYEERAFIPDPENFDFVSAHSAENYGWIFDQEDIGYVFKRD